MIVLSLARKIAISIWFITAFTVSSTFATVTPNPVPFLNPIVPATAVPGGSAFTMTVTGAGFVSGSVVYWNGASRPTTFVTSSSLTAAISAADIDNPTTATITVVSPGPGGGASNSRFFAVTNAVASLSWTVKDVTGNANVTSPVLAADFNNDGKLDIVGAVGQTVYVLLGNGDGTFQTPVGSAGPAGSTITGINIADVNGDGKLDLIVTGSLNASTSFVATLIGNGNGTFQAPVQTDFADLHLPAKPVMADFNGDGTLDLAFASGFNVQLILGNGDGTFRLGPTTALSQIPLEVAAAGDFNGDGKLDLVVTVYDLFTTGLDFVEVLPGIGDGTFGTAISVNGSGSSFVGVITVGIGDFNGDGKLDIATAIQTVGPTNQGIIQIALGNGDGTFRAGGSVPNVQAVTTPLLVADINGDGNLDLGTGGFHYDGRGDGTFPTYAGSTGTPDYVFVGDFNGDGSLDVLGATITLSGTSSLTALNVTLQAPPLPDFRGIVAPFNSILVPGSTITITGVVQPLDGFTGDVTIGVTGLPPGVTPSYNPVVVKGASGSSSVTLAAAPTTPLGDYNITLTGNSGSITHSTTVPITVSSTLADWSSAVVQPTLNIAPGASATYQFVISPTNGVSSGSILSSVTGLPPGATATFNPAIISGDFSGVATMTVETSPSTPQPQVYTMTVTGTKGVLVHSGPVYLGVSSAGGDFTGTSLPASASTSAGGSVTYTLSGTPVNGGAGDVSLSLSGLPGGAIGTFTPLVVPNGSGTSTLRVNTSTGTVPGTYTLIITSTGSGVIHQQGVNLVVTP